MPSTMPFSSRVRFMLTSSNVICKHQSADMAGQAQLATSMQKHSRKTDPGHCYQMAWWYWADHDIEEHMSGRNYQLSLHQTGKAWQQNALCKCKTAYLTGDRVSLQRFPVVAGSMTVDVQVSIPDLSNGFFFWHLDGMQKSLVCVWQFFCSTTLSCTAGQQTS